MNMIAEYSNRCYLILAAIVVVIGLFIWSSSFSTGYMNNPDAYDYAHMGNELLEHHQFSTRQLFPRHIPYLKSNGLLDQRFIPNLYRYPMPILSNAVAQGLIDTDVMVASVLQSGFWFFSSSLLFFIVARKLFGDLYALIGILLFYSISDFWLFSRSGLSETLAIFCVLLTTYALVSNDNTVMGGIFVGFCCAMAFLTKTQLAFLFPAVLLIKAFRFQYSHLAIYTLSVFLGFITSCFPWFVRNYLITGSSLFSFSSSRNFAMDSFYPHSDIEMQLNAPSTTGEVLTQYGGAILDKFSSNLAEGFLRFNSLIINNSALVVLLAFSIVSYIAIRPNNKGPSNWLFYWVFISLISSIIISSLAFHNPRFYVPIFPLFLLLGLSQVDRLISIISSQFSHKAANTACLLLFLMAGSTFIYTISEQSKKIAPKLEATIFSELGPYIRDNGVIVSNISDKVALHTKHISVRLPAFPEDLLKLANEYNMADYLLLTDYVFIEKDKPGIRFENYYKYPGFLRSDNFSQEYERVVILSNGWVLYKKIASEAQACRLGPGKHGDNGVRRSITGTPG